MDRLFDLNGKTAMITGARRGIGLGIATGLAQAGADIIGVGTSDIKDCSNLAGIVANAGRQFAYYQADLAKPQAAGELAKQVLAEHPRIDILVNNAGITHRKPVAEHDDELFDEVLSVNLRSQFILARNIGKTMVERGSGKVIFTASLLSFQGGVLSPGYAAAKGGIAQLTKAFANEWASLGINVNAIAPGYADTDLIEALKNDPERSKAILERIPAGRWGKPEDFAGPAIFLASAASDYVHGEVLMVDGGWMGR